MVLGGHKYHRLVLGPHHVAQQVEQHSSLRILPHEEEGGLQGEGSLRLAHGVQAVGREGARVEPHLELLVEFGVHVQPDEHGLHEACGGQERRTGRGVAEGQAPPRR